MKSPQETPLEATVRSKDKGAGVTPLDPVRVAADRPPSTVPAGPYTSKSILDVIGRKRMYFIVWRATPLPWRLIAFPYGVVVYRRLLAASDTLHYLRGMHTEKCQSSLLFRLLRPRYRKVERLLRKYGFADDGPGRAS